MSSGERQRQNRLQGRFDTPKRKSSPLQGGSQRQSLSPLSSDGSPSSLSSYDSSPCFFYKKSDFKNLERVVGPTVVNDHPNMIRTWQNIGETDNGNSVIYFDPDFLSRQEADNYLEALLPPRINWEEKEVVVRGERFPQPRKVHWIGPYEYRYSSVSLPPNNRWPEEVLEIKDKLQKIPMVKWSFNSVLLNLYRDERDSVAWHSDNELSMGVRPLIASVSLGDRRRFELKTKPPPGLIETPMCYRDAEYVVHLDHGSLLIMTGSLQDDWLHRVPKEPHSRAARVNLTYRTVFKT